MQSLILSGGMGTRLRPLTLYMPKPLLPVVNIPFLSYPLALLRKHGLGEAVLCTADSFEPYKSFVHSQKKLGTVVTCSRESQELGTAGALKNAEKLIRDFPVFVMNGDVLTNMNLTAMLQFHRKTQSQATIALMEVTDPSAYGLVALGGGGKIQRFIEKPKSLSGLKKPFWVNAGIYLLEREVLQMIPKGERCSVEKYIFPLCLRRGVALYGFRNLRSTLWLDIGNPGKYLTANKLILKNGAKAFGLRERPKWIGQNSRIGQESLIGKEVVIGNRCRIGQRCRIESSVLLGDIVIEDDAEIENCIIGKGCKVGHHSTIRAASVIGNCSTLTPYSIL